MKKLLLSILLLTASVAFGQGIQDPCLAPNEVKQSVAINVSAAATTQLVAISGTTSIYVCGFNFTAATGTAATYLLEYGSSASCGTVTATLTGAMAGNNSPLISMSAGMQFTKSASGNALCLVTGGTSPVAQGYLTYIQR